MQINEVIKPVDTKNVRTVKNAVREAVTEDRMVAIIAEYGSGKTTLYNHLADFWGRYPNKFRLVTIKGFKMSSSRGSAIMRLLIQALNPKADIPIHIESIYNLLAEELQKFRKTKDNKVILMIDEAQDMNRQTFRDIKKIYEIAGCGREHLLSVVLFGSPSKRWNMLTGVELGYRIHPVLLDSLSNDELLKIAEERFNLKFKTPKVRERFAQALHTKLPLGVEQFAAAIRRELKLPYEADAVVTDELVLKAPVLSLRIVCKQLGLTNVMLARMVNELIPNRRISPQRISEYFNGKITDEELYKNITVAIHTVIKDREKRVKSLMLGDTSDEQKEKSA